MRLERFSAFCGFAVVVLVSGCKKEEPEQAAQNVPAANNAAAPPPQTLARPNAVGNATVSPNVIRNRSANVIARERAGQVSGRYGGEGTGE